MLKMQTFLCNGDQHIGAHGNPDLRLHGVLAVAQKRLDAQVQVMRIKLPTELKTHYRKEKWPGHMCGPFKYWWDVRGSNPRQTD